MSKRRSKPAAGAVPVPARNEPRGSFDERLALRRARARSAASREGQPLVHPLPGRYHVTGYRAVSIASGESRSYQTKSGDGRAEVDREKLIAESRAHYADNALYRGVICRLVDAVVGNGYTLQLLSSDTDWNKRGEDLWREYWEKPEIRGLWSGQELERQACAELALAGDVGFIKTRLGLLQAIEAERISKGDRRTGLKLDKVGRVQSFYVRDYSASGNLDSGSQREIAAADMIFLARLERLSSSRGMPAMVPAFPMIHRISDVCDSNALAWQLISRLALKLVRKDAGRGAYEASRADASASADSTRFDMAQRVTDVGYGLVFHAEPGEDISGIERNLPQQNFTESLRAFVRVVGLPLGMPLEIILLDASQSNLSSMRGIYEQAWISFRSWQNLLVSGLHRPTAAWKLAEFVRAGRLPAPPEGLAAVRSSWIVQPFPWLEQLKEAQAWASKLDRGLETHARAIKSLGLDPDQVLAAREAEIRAAIRRAQQIEQETGVLVPWQAFCGLAGKGAESPAANPGVATSPEMPGKPGGGGDGEETPSDDAV